MTRLFATRAYEYLKGPLLAARAGADGKVDWHGFPDGERGIRIRTPARGEDAAIIGGTVDDAATLDLFDLACGLVDQGCRSLALAIPYFGYSTMERAGRRGDVVTAKARARLISAIPRPPGGLRVGFLDLHSEGLPYYLEGGLAAEHLYAKPLIVKAARRLGGRGFALGSVDAGRAAWVASLAEDMGAHAAFTLKRRLGGDKVEVLSADSSVRGRRVVIYDDMIRTGSSLVAAARAYRAAGARAVCAIATHGAFAPGAVRALEDSGALDAIACTDSHPRAAAARSPLVSVVSAARLLADFVAGRHYETH